MRLPTRKKELERMQSEEVDLHVTQKKFDQMQRDLHRLIDNDRPEAVLEVRRTGEMGDFSENAGYQIAKGTLRRINSRIETLQDRIARAVIIQNHSASDTVRIGSVVTVRCQGKESTFQILGSQESNPAKGKISHISPIGKALLHAKIGETVSIHVGDRVLEYQILAIT